MDRFLTTSMKITNKVVYKNLDELYDRCPGVKITDKSKWVIFSDLHMGDGSSTDDFKTNATLFIKALKDYYQPKKYSLFLNGDVEELQRFSMDKILRHWGDVFKIFDSFAERDALIKTIGNHDLELSAMETLPYDYEVSEAYKMHVGDDSLFLYHGHQASKKYQRHNQLVGFTLKYFANPLGIRNYSVSHSSLKQYKLERKLYNYSAHRNLVSVIGHTHRPLFESMHKIERLKHKIEQLCREYAEGKNLLTIPKSIKAYKKELLKHHRENEGHNYKSYVYNTVFHIPCLFNSGTVIGKRGMTCLEIEGNNIRLVHWFDKNISKKYLKNTGYDPEPLGDTDFYRMVINEEALDYIFARIKFLS
ncbi:MAG: metallophosphoesterase [Bacteroidota bacterium]